MSVKQLTDEEILEIFAGDQKKKRDEQEFSEVSLCRAGDKVFFEPLKFTEEDWMQKENKKLPYYIGQITDMAKLSEGKITLKALEPCSFLPSDETVEHPLSKTCAYSEEAEKGIPDMVDLDKLNNATLLCNLKSRYFAQPRDIYTYVTPSLLVVNPYCKVPHLMTQDIIDKCMEFVYSDKMTLKEIIPHTFSIAARALKQMYDNKERQAIVISGESGAGKTEAAKIAMSLLAHSGKTKEPGKKGIEERIIACSPVLEAFGNAKTQRNHNSSRFGKYVKIIFNVQEKQILGAITKPYLLEKSRIVKITEQDRNYHIFYHLLKGGPLDLLKKLFLVDEKGNRMTKEHFYYLKSGCDDIPTHLVDDVERYEELVAKFNDELNFSEDEQITVWNIVAAVLYIGNLDIDLDAYDIVKNAPCKVKNRKVLEILAKLLGCKPDDLEYEIVYRGKVGDANRSVCTPTEVVNQRDTLAKTLYNNLFSWLVARMNATILEDPSLLKESRSEIKTIGLLDIFGFECFQINDYEQLLINYTNEKLQKLYLNAVFEAEKITFKEEGLVQMIGKLQYTDRTTTVIELLDNRAPGKPQGILNKVDDYKRNEDARNLRSMIAKDFSKHENYVKHRDQDKFQIRHTAKLVMYSTNEFIEKNVDKLSDDLKAMMYERMDPRISAILKSEESANLGNTIWKKFSVQMKDLMEELAEPFITGKKTDKSEPCELHFIRCIKPNERASNNMFVDSLVLMQITYMGVLDTIKVRKVNFPHRVKYSRFYERYEDLCSVSLSTPLKILITQNPDFPALTRQIIKEQFGEIGKDQYLFGKTRMFMRNEAISALEEARARAQSKKNESASFIQDSYYAFQARKAYNHRMSFVIKLQKKYKIRFEKRITRNALKFALKLEKSLGTYKTEKRKAVEESASQKIATSVKAVAVRIIIKKGLNARKNLLNWLLKVSGKAKIRKAVLCVNTTLDIFKKAWIQITRKMMGDASKTLVRICKGYGTRKKFEEQIAIAKERAEFLKTTKAALLIQKRLKGADIRVRLGAFKIAARKIQRWIKSVWLQRMIKQTRTAVAKIQRRFRFHYRKAHERNAQWREFMETQTLLMSGLRHLENNLLFGEYGLDNNKPDSKLKAISPTTYAALLDSVEKYNKTVIAQHLKPVSPYSTQKAYVFSLILDIYPIIDTTSIYPEGWSANWIQFAAEMMDNDMPPLGFDIGTAHTLAVNSKSQLFAWGINSHDQCGSGPITKIYDGKFSKPIAGLEEARIKQFACGNTHSLVLDHEGNLYVWGGNEQGQLGSGNYETASQPQRLINSVPIGEVKEISVGGDVNIAVTNEGEAYMWPTQDLSNETVLIPVKLPFTKLVQIESAACGTDFAVLLSTQGLVFSFGKAADSGQLGHGDKRERLSPELVEALRECGERIQAVACGHAHCVVKSSLGKVYTWGWGALGQLGLGTLNSELSPKLITSYKESPTSKDTESGKKKALNISAGYSHTVILTEGRTPYYCGTCGSLEKQDTPVRLPLEKLYPDIFPKGLQPTTSSLSFTIGKIAVAWSKSASITYATVLDMRTAGLASSPKTRVDSKTSWSGNSIVQQLNLLSTKWNPKDMDPPYIESLAGIFSAAVMRKPVTTSKKKPVPRNPQSATSLIKAALKRGIKVAYDGAEKGMEEKVQEIEQRIQLALEKDPEFRTERENAMVSHFVNKVFK